MKINNNFNKINNIAPQYAKHYLLIADNTEGEMVIGKINHTVTI